MRRLLRVSLRTLLVLVTLGCLLLGWRVEVARRQADAVQRWRALGGYVRYDFEYPLTFEEMHSPVPDWLLRTAGVDLFHRVHSAGLYSAENLSDGEVSEINFCLANFSDARWVDVTCGDTETLKTLGRLRQFRHLSIANVHQTHIIESTDLSYLRSLSRLTMLHIGRVDMSDDAITAICKHHPNLEHLYLATPDSVVGDQILEPLEQWSMLQTFELIGRKPLGMTDASIDHFQPPRTLKTLGCCRRIYQTRQPTDFKNGTLLF